jgi:hypothetical protein
VSPNPQSNKRSCPKWVNSSTVPRELVRASQGTVSASNRDLGKVHFAGLPSHTQRQQIVLDYLQMESHGNKNQALRHSSFLPLLRILFLERQSDSWLLWWWCTGKMYLTTKHIQFVMTLFFSQCSDSSVSQTEKLTDKQHQNIWSSH